MNLFQKPAYKYEIFIGARLSKLRNDVPGSYRTTMVEES